MTTTFLRRSLTSPLKPRLSLRLFSATPPPLSNPTNPPPPPPPLPLPPPAPPQPHFPQTRTPLEKQFESWVQHLKSGFTPSDLTQALRSQSDPDLAYDIFRWAALRRGYKHHHSTYLAMIELAISGKRHRIAETLLQEVLAGACPPVSLPLYNSLIRFCCSHRSLFTKAFDVYKKMISDEGTKPNLETYALLFDVLLRRFDKLNVCFVYLNAVRSLSKQMKVFGVIPDTFVLNLIIKAYGKCLLVDEAIRVFHDMGLYGCEPNEFTYSYLAKACCEKERVGRGFGFYKEMREKGLVPTNSTFLVLVCSLALERRFEDAVEVLRDMLENSKVPDLLTYKTLLEELCRSGKADDAFELLEEFRKKDVSMTERTYKTLLDDLHYVD